MADNTSSRRLNNKKNAIMFATVGLGVFVSDGKVPLIPRYNKLDTELTQQEREQAVEDFMQKHDGQEPVHVGATTDIEVVKKLFRRFPDAVPSIACGPSKLVVLDADAKDNGPELLTALFDDHGGVPEGAPVIPTKSGGKHLIFADPNGAFTNKAGLLKKSYGTDVRGTGGQFVAPGSIREDGKTYGTNADKINFLRAYTSKMIPQLPDFVVERIGAADESRKDEVAPSREREVILQLEQADWDQHEHAFDADPTIAEYDLDALKQTNAEFAALYDSPSEDCSTNRFLAARMVMTEWPDMPVEALSIFFSNWEGAGSYTDEKPKSGEYDDRQIAREWLKNQGLSKPSKGEAFGAVDDEDEYDRQIRQDKEIEKQAAIRAEMLQFMSEFAIYHEPDYIVENTFTPGQIGMIHGPSNVGKTFTVIHLGERIVAGLPWFGLNVAQGGVLYCFGEGHAGLRNRGVAYRKKYDDCAEGMIVRGGIPNLALHLKNAKKALRKAVLDANKMYEARGLPNKRVKVVFLDTFAKAIAGAQENDVAAIQPILNALRELCVELDICIIIVHHSGKDTMLGPRGSSAIVADVDFNLEIVSHDEAKKRKLSAVKPGQLAIISPKMRDSKKGGVLTFKLDEVELGTNRWGNPVTSMAVVEAVDRAQSTGSAFDAVDEGDEAPASDDELTPDQNRREEEQRLALCAKVMAAIRQCGKVTGNAVHASQDEVLELVPALRKLRIEGSSKNFARNLKATLLGGDMRTLLPEGWIAYVPGAGRKPNTFTFTARAVAT